MERRLNNPMLNRRAAESRKRGIRVTKNRNSLRSLAASEVERLEARDMLAVTYHGGQLLPHVEAQAVYLGSDWNQNASLHSQTGAIDGFLSSLTQGAYMDTLTQAGYNVGRGSASAGVVANVAIDKSVGISDAQIRARLQSMIGAAQVAAPDANRLYMVYVEPGVLIRSSSGASNNAFLGYHGAYAGTDAAGHAVDIRYAVIAYPGSPNPTSSSQGFGTALDQLTAVSSHELAEAVTDPDVNYKTLGWYDDRLNGEIGDLTSATARLEGFLIQLFVDRNSRVLPVTTTPAGQIGNPGGTTSGGVTQPAAILQAPGNLLGTPLSPTTVRLTWDYVPGARGYQVYQLHDGQEALLATLGPWRGAYRVTGLPSGTNLTFEVKAIAGAEISPAATVTVTTPSPSTDPLTAPSVTASEITYTGATLRWNSVSGADGYRVYWLNGDQRVLLGSVNAYVLSVRVTGLKAGETSSFVVEAFRGDEGAASATVAVTTPSPTPTIQRWWGWLEWWRGWHF